MARAARESRQQAHTIAWCLARALRALAGGFSWERLRDGPPVDNLPEIPREYGEIHRNMFSEEQALMQETSATTEKLCEKR